ncbi:MAG: hypothetical protein IPQ07_00330 [Myxococcales bacterium]|nr:hypothetical protein [Myxococcales bacterium]
MARPDVTISAPDPLFVGRELAIEFNITAHKETKVEFIEARLVGDQGWAVGSGKSQVTMRLLYPKFTEQLMAQGVLPAATTTRFVAKFTLPPGTPPTHEVGPAWSRMRLYVHISIPWALDGRHRYDFAVRIPAPPVERLPVAMRSTSEPGKPRIELGLASSRLIVGEELVGTCAVFHLDDAEPREVALAFVPELTLLRRSRPRERRGEQIAGTMTIPAGSAGTSVPFRIRLPLGMTPTFEAPTHTLRWWLIARTGSFFGGRVDVAVPLEVFDRVAASMTPKLEAAPRLGDERIATLFAEFAAGNGWSGAEPGSADFAIEKDLRGSDLRIGYAYRGEHGAFLVASVHTRSLGLGLSVAPASSLRHMFWKDVEVDIAVWDRAHHVKARYPDQAIPFLKGVVPALMTSSHLGTMVRWGDSDLVFERKVAGVSAEDLGIVAAELEVVALTIASCLPSIAAPPSIVADLPSWHALAGKLGGTLALGDLGITGVLDGMPVDLGLAWLAERPASVHVAVGAPDLGSDLVKAVVISLPRPASDVLAANAAERLVELITRWPSDVVDLRVEHGVASASLLLPGGDPPVADATRVRELVEQLCAVLGALDPGAGPYR